MNAPHARMMAAIFAGVVVLSWIASAAEPVFTPDEKLAAMDRAIDYSRGQLIAVQHEERYKTLDSFARETITAMTGTDRLPGLTPIGSLLEWSFNFKNYADVPTVYVKDRGVRIHFSAHMPVDVATRIRNTGMMTLRELIDPVVRQRKAELDPKGRMSNAMNRVNAAMAVAFNAERMLQIVPRHTPLDNDRWATPVELVPNLRAELRDMAAKNADLGELGEPLEGVDQGTAEAVLGAWAMLKMRWLERDAAGVQESLDKLAAVLPSVAKAGEYPAERKLKMEALYYRMGKFTGGSLVYFLGAIFSVWAIVTRWKTPWILGIIALIAALGLHGFGLGLRWSILGRIPIANMFEAMVGSSFAGILLVLILELVYRSRAFLLAANVCGFLMLVIAEQISPGGGTLTSIRAILDDVMLRIHTTMIVSSYALIFLAGVIAVAYLFGYYLIVHPARSAEAGLIALVGGISLWGVSFLAFGQAEVGASMDGFAKLSNVATAFGVTAAVSVAALIALALARAPGNILVATGMLLVACLALTFGHRGFVVGTAYTLAGSGFLWACGTLLGSRLRAMPQHVPALAVAGGPHLPLTQFQRPILAGGAPGDESRSRELPRWLLDFDWSQLILLNLVFVLLFVGTILGAVWADYSWGRPWGWDPKEVFALNTWIIYAILIHIRFVVKQRGLWTAWLSVAGCVMMAFNWIVVNTYIVGLHSYA
jgi:ABC-type transport system involved in cytochrome c biogenesis permease subunit